LGERIAGKFMMKLGIKMGKILKMAKEGMAEKGDVWRGIQSTYKERETNKNIINTYRVHAVT
jgi:hypothetical protein